jgi:hypothetical protein
VTAEPTEITEEPTALYRLFGTAGVLLYVGISRNPAARWAQHAADKTWWPQVVKKTVVMYGSRREAEVAEGRAIRSESPAHNLAPGRSDPEAARRPVRKLRSPDPQLRRPRDVFSLEPFIAAYAAEHKCTRDDAVGGLIFAGILKRYTDKFADPVEAMTALDADMAALRRSAA